MTVRQALCAAVLLADNALAAAKATEDWEKLLLNGWVGLLEGGAA
jgi:hypothetical protein